MQLTSTAGRPLDFPAGTGWDTSERRTPSKAGVTKVTFENPSPSSNVKMKSLKLRTGKQGDLIEAKIKHFSESGVEKTKYTPVDNDFLKDFHWMHQATLKELGFKNISSPDVNGEDVKRLRQYIPLPRAVAPYKAVHYQMTKRQNGVDQTTEGYAKVTAEATDDQAGESAAIHLALQNLSGTQHINILHVHPPGFDPAEDKCDLPRQV